MAIFDQSMFDPQTYSGGMSGWLQQALQTGLLGGAIGGQGQAQQPPMQPQTGPTFANGNAGSMGGVQFPIMGQPQQSAELPPNAQPTQYSPPAPQAAPQNGGFGDSLSAGFQGFANSKGLVPAISNLIGGLTTGKRTDQMGMTIQALIAKGLDENTARAIAGNPTLLAAAAPTLFGSKAQTDDIKEFEYAKAQGFKGGLADWMAHKRAGAGEYGLNAIWGTGPDGKPAIVQLGKSGTAIQSKLPEGVQVGKDVIKIDAGTETILLDPVTRQPIGRIPKNIEGKEIAEKVGAATGAAKVDLPRIRDNATFMLKAIDDVMNDPSREMGTGASAVSTYIPGTGAYDFGQKVAQLKGKTFLEAFNSLKGGGQITEVEGQKATDAIGRLSTFQTEEGFKAALKDLREVVVAGLERTRKLAGGEQPSIGPSQSPAAETQPQTAVNPKTGQRIMLQGGQWVPMK